MQAERNPRSSRGKWAEAAALRYLEARGLVCRARNYRCRFGEIDLVMDDEGIVVFVEVRSRAATRFMDPSESVDHAKRMRLVRTAEVWLRREVGRRRLPECRFDVVAVTGNCDNPHILWLRGAFDA